MGSIRSSSTTSSTSSDFDTVHSSSSMSSSFSDFDDDAPGGPITISAIKGWILGNFVAVLFIVGYLRIRALPFFVCLFTLLPTAQANGHLSYPFERPDDTRQVFSSARESTKEYGSGDGTWIFLLLLLVLVVVRNRIALGLAFVPVSIALVQNGIVPPFIGTKHLEGWWPFPLLWGLLALAMFLHARNNPRLLMFNTVIIMTAFYTIWAECMNPAPSFVLESIHESNGADTPGVQLVNDSARGVSLDSWLLMTLVILWNLVWLTLFWDIWGLFVDALV